MPVGPTPPLHSLLSPRYFPMSLNSLRQPPSSTPSFRRIFPFKLKYLALNSKLGFQTTSSFSTRPFNSRPKATPPLSKSLIEDEDELSDWVSGLRTSSIRSGIFTDDEEGQERGDRKKRGRESNFTSDGDERGFREVGKKGRENNFTNGGEERGFREVGKKGFRGSSNFGRNSSRDDGKGREFGMRGGRAGRGGGGGGRGGGRFGGERGYGVRGCEGEGKGVWGEEWAGWGYG